MSDSPLPALWDMDSADYECDCPGPPPPVFHLPPPPRPPFLHELADCSEAPLLDLETCDAMPVSPTFTTIHLFHDCTYKLCVVKINKHGIVYNK